ncbi:MAG: hypothetical protein AAF585_01775 [Verrucomicrobiota bacterium]
MTGLIWVVQIVIYPQFHDVGENAFHAYHDEYMMRIGFVVLPLMLGEAALCGISIWLGWRSKARRQLLISGTLIAAVWASTFFIQAPIHVALTISEDPQSLIDQLVSTNWIRTALWTLRTALLARLVNRVLRT